jgi:hypothetical protein
LPNAFGGSRTIPRSAYLDELEKQEKDTGYIGGFAFPLNVDDPTGLIRRLASSIRSKLVH